jgi:glycosyltransferase involved in cell wall biosynthesis
MVKFSIITVCLNASNTIGRCMESVANQTFKNFEHIVIDGKSTDGTLKVLSKYVDVHVISEKDEGIYFAMNKGIELAKGEYIIFLNADDEFCLNYLEEINKVNSNYDFISVGVKLVYNFQEFFWINNSGVLKKSKYWEMPFPHPGLAVKRSLLIKIGGFNVKYKLAADFDLIIKLLNKTRNGIFLESLLVNFFAGGQSQKFSIIKENFLVRKSNYGYSIFLIIYLLKDFIRLVRGYLFR